MKQAARLNSRLTLTYLSVLLLVLPLWFLHRTPLQFALISVGTLMLLAVIVQMILGRNGRG
jgi:heme/copper-type cytochrome/quinol oxidase subunit 4